LKNQFYHIHMPKFSINTQESDSKQTGLIYNDGVSTTQLRLSKADIDRWNIPIDSLKFGPVLGKGAFGVVMYGECAPYTQADVKRPVAIKKLKENATRHNLDDLFEELHTMLHVGEHKNIINLVGFSFDCESLDRREVQRAQTYRVPFVSPASLYIVTEFAKHGNLKDYVRKTDELNSGEIQTRLMLLYAYQIAAGMEYLHAKKVSYSHCRLEIH
jgi:serine/threonine protein kinase